MTHLTFLVGGTPRRCICTFLTIGVLMMTFMPRVHAGYCNVMRDKKFTGRDLPRGLVQTKDTAACCVACRQRKECRAFVFETKARLCTLKSVPDFKKLFEEKGFMTGAIGYCRFRRGAEYAGDVLGTVKATNQHDCCAQCKSRTGCVGFTFVQGSRSCTLKSTVGPVVMKTFGNRSIFGGVAEYERDFERAREWNDTTARLDYWWRRLERDGVATVTPEFRETLQLQKFVPSGHTLHLFVRYSAYRDSLNSFYIVGLGANKLMEKIGKPVTNCAWLPGKIDDILTLGNLYSSPRLAVTSKVLILKGHRRDIMETDYQTLVVKCTFLEPVGDIRGGTLFLKVPTHKLDDDAGIPEEAEMVPVLHESSLDENLFRPPVVGEEPQYQYQHIMCGEPLRNDVNASNIREWVFWYKALFMNDVHFFIYLPEEITGELADVLQHFVHRKLMTLIDIREQVSYEGWYYNQALFLNDCIHRSRHRAEWAFNFDYDEFVYVWQKGVTIKDVLHKYKDKPYLSVGCWDYSAGLCIPKEREGQWQIERMVFRKEKKNCTRARCSMHSDRRKWAANLKMTLVVNIHFVYVFESPVAGLVLDDHLAYIRWYSPINSTIGGVVLDENVLFMAHYRGLWRNQCNVVVRPSFTAKYDRYDQDLGLVSRKWDGVEKYKMDLSVARVAGQLVQENHWEHVGTEA